MQGCALFGGPAQAVGEYRDITKAKSCMPLISTMSWATILNPFKKVRRTTPELKYNTIQTFKFTTGTHDKLMWTRYQVSFVNNLEKVVYVMVRPNCTLFYVEVTSQFSVMYRIFLYFIIYYMLTLKHLPHFSSFLRGIHPGLKIPDQPVASAMRNGEGLQLIPNTVAWLAIIFFAT